MRNPAIILVLMLMLSAGVLAGAISSAALAAENVPSSTAPTDAEPPTGEDVVVYLAPDDGNFDSVIPPLGCSAGSLGSYDNESLRLYMQRFPASFEDYQYDSTLDEHLSQQNKFAYPARPAVVTLASGTFVYYIADDFSIRKLSLNSDSDVEVVGAPANAEDPRDYVTSIAVSQDGERLAYLKVNCNADTLVYDNSVYVLDLAPDANNAEGPIKKFEISAYDDAQPVRKVGSVAFDYAGTKVVFDAEFGSDGARFWSVGILDLGDSRVGYLLANQDSTPDLRYPSFAYNNSYVVVMDYADANSSNVYTYNLQVMDSVGADSSHVYTHNIQEQSLKHVVKISDDGVDWGMPSFWGDDDYVTIQKPTEAGGISTYRVPINDDWSGDPANLLSLNAFDATMPIMHREAVRPVTIELAADADILDFGNVNPGGSTLKVHVTNTGNVDTKIIAVDSSNDTFGHNGITTDFPKGQSITLDVIFNGTNNGTQTGELSLSYGIDRELIIPLIATVGTNFKRGELQSSKAALNFGQVLRNETETQTLILSNLGDEDVVITGVELSAGLEKFSHDAAENMVVPALDTKTVTVEFAARRTTGVDTGTLTFHYFVDSKVEVVLSGQSVASINPNDEEDGGEEDDVNDGSSRASVGAGTDGSAGLGSLSYYLILLMVLRVLTNLKMRRLR